MPTLQDIEAKTLGQINSLTTALKITREDLFPVGDVSMSANPIEFLVNIFKSLKGYDWLVEKISKYIVYVLPGLEWTVKVVLLANIQAMLSCSINPIITRKLILEGTVFDVKKIDLLNIFKYSPLDTNPSNTIVNKKRNYYYFGCTKQDGVEYIDDLKNVRDFNAVLWYARNTPEERIVWRRKKDIGKPIQVRNAIPGSSGLVWPKQKKSNGIVTIEYNVNSNSLKDSEANPMSLQEPMEDCMHVYIGCNVPLYDQNIEATKADISDKTRNIAEYDSLIEQLEDIKRMVHTTYLDEIDALCESSGLADENGAITLEPFEDVSAENELISRFEEELQLADMYIDKISTASHLTTIADELAGYIDTNQDGSLSKTFTLAGPNGTEFVIRSVLAQSTRKKEISEKVALQASVSTAPCEYPSPFSNYYYLHPLIEFNADFVLSMDPMFDEKVITAQLIDAITGMFSLSGFGQISFQTMYIEAQIRELVTKIITRDTAFVNDCFFSFTNDSYNSMLHQAELSRVGLYNLSGTDAQNVPSPDEIMESLNNLSPDATKEEVKTAIEGALFKAVSSTNPHGPGEWSLDGKVNGNILTSLLEKLIYVIVTTILSPKIYILIMMNMKIMEEDISFDLQKFIEKFKDMIIELIQTIKNAILDWFIQELNALIKELASQLATRLVLEQFQYYVDLIKKCVSCIKLYGKQYDWAMDDVNYADITEITNYVGDEC